MRTSRVVVHKSMVCLIYINTPACSALVGPDTSVLPAAALVFNFSDDVGAAPPPEKAHHTGHSCHCKPPVLAVSCCTNNAVSLSGVVADTHTRTRDWTGRILIVSQKEGSKTGSSPSSAMFQPATRGPVVGWVPTRLRLGATTKDGRAGDGSATLMRTSRTWQVSTDASTPPNSRLGQS